MSGDDKEKLYTITSADLSLAFKRQGHFDRVRKELFDDIRETEMGTDFVTSVRRMCEEWVGVEANVKDADREAIQRRLIRHLESNTDMFSRIQQDIGERLRSRSHEYRERMERQVDELVDRVNDEQISKNQTDYKPELESPVEEPVPKATNASLFEDILNMAYLSKSTTQPSAPPSPVKKRRRIVPPATLVVIDVPADLESIDVKPAKEDTADPATKLPYPKRKTIESFAESSSDHESEQSDASSEKSVEGSQGDEQSDEEVDQDDEKAVPMEEFSQVFLKGQKLAAFSPTNEGHCHVVIVKSFNVNTGLYAVTLAQRKSKDVWHLPFEKLIYFNFVEKKFNVGQKVFSLYRSRGTGLSSEFSAATVTRAGENVVHVEFDGSKDTQLMKFNEVFAWPS